MRGRKRNNFFTKVYSVVVKIPKGKVSTYGQIAKKLETKDSRKVGWALHANTDRNVPCHRVVNKDGKLASGFAFGGYKEQKELLLNEGVVFKDEMNVDLNKCLQTPFNGL